MKDRGIDIVDRFGYEPGLLSDVQQDPWFIGNTEPRQSEHYKPAKAVEDLMDQFVCPSGVVMVTGHD